MFGSFHIRVCEKRGIMSDHHPAAQTAPKGWRADLRLAFIKTIPIMTGFLFLGLSYGILMRAKGFPFFYPMLMALTIFGGSLEFVAVEMLLAPFAPFHALVMSFMIQARHIFYGISMLKRYQGAGKKKFYLIFGMCDESFSINYSTEVPEGIDRFRFMFFVNLLNQAYWVTAATLGGLLGSLITFDTGGIEFVIIAMFTVIFLDSWLKEKQHWSSLIGVLGSLAMLLVFGTENFMIPSMALIVILLTAFRRPISGKEGAG